VACLSPIPLRARPAPPIVPDLTDSGAAAGTFALVDVYDGRLPWPEGVRIQALRVIQLLPKSTAPPNRPRIGIGNQTNARAVLGTVPVAADGSAHFTAPAGKPLYFQALDARGRAVQSMRSVTYLQPGQRLACQGCHEPKTAAPAMPRRVPLAFRRRPSDLRPPPEGANPFSYPRLVQPVLDRHCAGCHAEQPKACDLSGAPGERHGWSKSYESLARAGFHFDAVKGCHRRQGSRTVPGEFGARASRLVDLLDKGHHGVKLPPEDLRRIVLWLDCNSEFYGAYEDIADQAAGKIVRPALE